MPIPESLRVAAGLEVGDEVELALRHSRIEIEPVPVPMRVVGRAVEASEKMPVLTTEQVHDLLNRIRR